MNIKNCTNAINAYKSATFDKEQKNKTVLGSKEKNIDKAEFSVNINNIKSVKASIVKNVDADASTEKISALKSQINEGNYYIPSENIVSSI